MKSMKAYMPVLLLGLLTFVAGTSAAQSTQQFSKPDTGVAIPNPCNSAMVTSTGTTHVTYHVNGNHITSHLDYSGTATDTANNAYTVSINANAQNPDVLNVQLPAGWTIYVFPYQATFTGQNGAPSFSLNGKFGVLIIDGVLKDNGLMTGTTACSN